MYMNHYDTDKFVARAQEKNIPLIDVRPAAMFAQGHIPGAINIPLADVDKAPIQSGSYLYCMTGYHAGLAKEALAAHGIAVTDIGGMDYYTGPVEK